MWKAAISGFLVSQGSAEALVRWGRKIKYPLIAYFLSNMCQNYQNRFVNVKVTARVRDKVVAFLGHSVYAIAYTLCPKNACDWSLGLSYATRVGFSICNMTMGIGQLRIPGWLMELNTPFTRYNRLSNRLSNGFDNRFDNRVERTATVCTTGLTTGCIHDTAVCQTGCQTGLTTGWMFVYTIQPVVKPVWQQVVSCKRGLTVRRTQIGAYLTRTQGLRRRTDHIWRLTALTATIKQ